PEKTEADWDGTVEILALSGDSPRSLAAELEKHSFADWPVFAAAAEKSRAAFRANASCRLLLVVQRDVTDLPKLIASARANLAGRSALSWQTPDGAYFGSGPPAGTLGVLFPGQGSQAVGMLRQLVCTFPEALDALAAANRMVAEQSTDETDGRRLSDLIYP